LFEDVAYDRQFIELVSLAKPRHLRYPYLEIAIDNDQILSMYTARWNF